MIYIFGATDGAVEEYKHRVISLFFGGRCVLGPQVRPSDRKARGNLSGDGQRTRPHSDTWTGSGASNLSTSLGRTGRRGVVLGHPSNTQRRIITHRKKPHRVLSKFSILCWAAFTAVLRCEQPRPQAVG